MRIALVGVLIAVPAGADPPEPPDLFGIDVGAHMRLQVGDASGRHDQWDQLDNVTIGLAKNRKPVWTKHGWKELTGTEDKAMPPSFHAATCKLFNLFVYPQKLDKRDGIRLSLECKNHDMTHLDREIVVATDILIDAADSYHVLYVGDGSSYDDGGQCDLGHAVTYALAGKKLTIATTETRGKSCTNPGSTTSTKIVTL